MLAAVMLLAGCGGFDVLPFGGGAAEQSRAPANATAYACDGGKRLYVRVLEGGGGAWVFLPERQVRLDRAAGAGTTYRHGNLRLELSGGEAVVFDGTTPLLSGCKTGS